MKEIQIISENYDKSTDLVLEWLLSRNSRVERLNIQDLSKINIHLSDTRNEVLINENASKKIWNRRGKIQLINENVRSSNLVAYLSKEAEPIVHYIESFFKKNNILKGSYIEESLNNKLVNLQIAKDVGLKIPETFITNNKKYLIDFYDQNANVISKVIFSSPVSNDKNFYFDTPGTFLINREMIDNLDDYFVPSLFQVYIKKKIEIRSFVWESKVFSMAIFSQSDNKTKIDYRNYNHGKENRTIPFDLPNEIEEKLLAFMKSKQLNTGSIDFIVTPNNDFVFLEVNPQGQFHWLSKNCNFYIHKYIAQKLNNKL